MKGVELVGVGKESVDELDAVESGGGDGVVNTVVVDVDTSGSSVGVGNESVGSSSVVEASGGSSVAVASGEEESVAELYGGQDSVSSGSGDDVSVLSGSDVSVVEGSVGYESVLVAVSDDELSGGTVDAGKDVEDGKEGGVEADDGTGAEEAVPPGLELPPLRSFLTPASNRSLSTEWDSRVRPHQE